jgi:hypothetical protein
VTTAFSKIVGAVIDALQADPPVCPAVYRARREAIPDALEQAVSVQWDQASAQPAAIFGAPIDWATRLSVECYARTSVTDSSGDAAVDPLLQAVFERLAQDPTLGGLVQDLNVVGLEAENSAEGKKTGWVRITYLVQHQTSNSTLE